MRNTVKTKVLVATLAMAASAFKPAGERASMAHREFGFALNPNPQGGLVTLFIYTVLDGEVVDARPMRPGPFILQMAGIEESIANIEGVDLLDEYGILGCGPSRESSNGHDDMDCPAISELWKLRYRSAPVQSDAPGWAGEDYRPSDRQQVLLQVYRQPQHPDWHGPYFGKDAFRLLRDIQDPNWVHTYRDGG